jgi:PAS domain S-box-containing protein
MITNTLKILFLEDDEDDAQLISLMLKKAGIDFNGQRVASKEQYIESIRSFAPDIVLSDHSLPQFNSTEALRICKKETPLTPFILVTGAVSEEFAVECLIQGADDYLLKSNLIRLPSAILSAIKKKQAELEKNIAVEILRKNEEHFRRLIENSSDIFAILKPNNTIEYLSPSAKKVLGYSIDELKDKSITSFVHSEDQDSIRKIIYSDTPGKEEKLTLAEFRFMHKDGNWKYLECISKPDNQKEFLILNIRDITERKLNEEELKHKNSELEKINKELDRFVYSASHDLRAPLKSVLGLVKLSQMDYQMNKFDSIHQYSSLIEKSIMKLDDTIQKIINYSGNARADFVYESINFEEIINEIFEELRYMDWSNKIEVELNIEGVDTFISDKNRIIVIFNNLISNAIKYRRRDIEDAYIRIYIHQSAQEVQIVFEDNGIGIKNDYLDKIFNMFYRATEASDGSGLGLYIVKEIVEKLDADIKVESEYYKGTKFTICIPNMADHIA